MTREELDEWKRDITEAEQTSPAAFANKALIKSLFRTTQTIDVVGQLIAQLSSSVRQSSDSLKESVKVAKDANESAERLSISIFWLNVILAIATALGAIATIAIAWKTVFG